MPTIIPLSQDKFALISDEDAARILVHKWSYSTGKNGKGYAARNTRVVLPDGTIKQRKILLHREILNAPDSMEVDHENGDGLDCQRHNLRIATRSQNMANTGSRKGSRVEYKGVSIRHRRTCTRWRAEITIDRQKYDLGTYPCPVEAAIAYDLRAVATWPKFASLNFEHLRMVYKSIATIIRLHTHELTFVSHHPTPTPTPS